MPLRFLFDEDLRGPLWNAVVRHNAIGRDPLDVVRVGDAHGPQLGWLDPQVLHWAEVNQRIFVTFDKSTMQRHVREHLAAGHVLPGVLQVRPNASVRDVLEYLVAAAYASRSDEWRNGCWFIP